MEYGRVELTAEEVINFILKNELLDETYKYNPDTREIESQADLMAYGVVTYTNGEVKSIIVHTLDNTHSYCEIYLQGDDYMGMIYEAVSEETTERLGRIWKANYERKKQK